MNEEERRKAYPLISQDVEVYLCFSERWRMYFCIGVLENQSPQMIAKQHICEVNGLSTFSGHVRCLKAKGVESYLALMCYGSTIESLFWAKDLRRMRMPYCPQCNLHDTPCGKCNGQHWPAKRAIDIFYGASVFNKEAEYDHGG